MPRSDKAEANAGELSEEKPNDPEAANNNSDRRPPSVLFILAAILIVAGYFGFKEFYERLDYLHEEDARIHSRMVTLSSRVAGWVARVAAVEGQRIQAGTVLVAIDQREARLLIDELMAQLEAVKAEKGQLRAEQDLVRMQTESHLRSARSGLRAARVAVSSLEPQLELAKRDLARNRQLFKQKVASRRQLDQSETRLQRIEREYQISVANLERENAKVKEAEAERARLGVLAGELEVLGKHEIETNAKIRRQHIDLDDRTIKSPLKGVVDRTFVEVGEYVTPGQRLMLLHDPSQIWIEANIKETEIRRLAIGQKVDVRVDAYPDQLFEGKVERIGNTATSTFALLPSPNPSGNFTKITQRLPVRIAIDQWASKLRPGMMVEIKIATGD